MVACKFSGDGNYYRALVMDIPCYAVKIGLKVHGISKLTPEAVRLLNTFILNNEELKIVFPDGDLRNCELITKSGVSLNDKIAEPSIKSPSTNSDGRIKWTSEMVGKLEIPESGSLSIKFLILHCPGKCTIVGCAAEDPRIALVYKTFPAEVTEYCEKCPQVPYVPVAYELCLAKFTDGLWYRGFAVDAKGDESQIYFVDFGNWMKVKHKDIRKMVPEFMKVPFIAVLCTYKGFEEETMTKEQESALKEHLKPNTLFFASISQGHDPDEYILDISQVTKELRSKNLLP
ncbi:hypothetical protein J437_LFUL018677 [Ladona fulva]|nr:hypothetical protein J437_LFUL018677 [Ladona fulva]